MAGTYAVSRAAAHHTGTDLMDPTAEYLNSRVEEGSVANSGPRIQRFKNREAWGWHCPQCQTGTTRRLIPNRLELRRSESQAWQEWTAHLAGEHHRSVVRTHIRERDLLRAIRDSSERMDRTRARH